MTAALTCFSVVLCHLDALLVVTWTYCSLSTVWYHSHVNADANYYRCCVSCASSTINTVLQCEQY